MSGQSGRTVESANDGLPVGRELDVVQGSPEWLDMRRSLRMASETPAILGLSPYQTAEHVRRAKLGNPGFVNAAMRKGRDQEHAARLAYGRAFDAMRPAFFVAGEYGCSLDGIGDDGKSIVEIKTPYRGADSERWRLAARRQVADYDNAQIQHQLMVCRAKLAYLWVWDADRAAGLRVEIRPDRTYWKRIRAGWDEFWPSLERQ